MLRRLRRHPKKIGALVALVLLPLLAHAGITLGTHIEPPAIVASVGEPQTPPDNADLRVLGPAYARHRGHILEVRLDGSPEAIGHQHGRLLYSEMVEDEGALLGDFRKYIPFAPLRWMIKDLSRLQFRDVDVGMPEPRRREIAAQAVAFSPDPYESFLPTYHRFVFLQSLYDIALSFEHSPLLGCTSFALTGNAFEGGHVILARNFDFEAGPIFDDGKVVFLVREEGRIPYASVSWPGFIGAVTGMNAEGVALVVHGGRAKSAEPRGEPVVHTMREVLGRAHSTDEAIKLLETKNAMVSHIVMLVDASGDAAIVERAPGVAPFVRRGTGKVPLTNHFEGPLRNDPANLRVEATTSTRARRARLDELLENLPAGASVERVVATLRDKAGPHGAEAAIGDRRSLDAIIATHAVVMDTTARVLWVSEGPHLLGRFIRFDLGELLKGGDVPPLGDVRAVAEDPIFHDGTYDKWIQSGSPHSGAQ